jgi:outer membrane protein assembly factor BamB
MKFNALPGAREHSKWSIVAASAVVAASVWAIAVSAVPAWPQFRGPNCCGVLEFGKPPIEFGATTNLLWKINLPPGLSSPSIWQDRIFLTAYESNKIQTICVRRRDGKILWVKAAPGERVLETNPTSSPASGTPATEGKRVYVYFGSYGVLAYDLNGRESWRRPLAIPTVLYGSGTSPALMEGRLIINRDQEDGKSSILALDTRTGQTVWETHRADSFSSYTTPVFWKHDGISEVVLAGSFRVVGYGLNNGKERWSARGLEAMSVCPTPVIGDGMLYAMSFSFGESKLPSFADIAAEMDKDGDHRISRSEAQGFMAGVFDLIDKNKDGFVTEEEWDANVATLNRGESGIFALRAPGKGDVTATHVVWKQTRGAATVSSPLLYLGRVYIVQDGGRVTCYEAKTGKPIYQQERLGAEGEYYASPVAANSRVYFCSTRGVVSVIECQDSLKVVAQNQLAERIVATPALADNKLYIRTATHLWAFGTHKRAANQLAQHDAGGHSTRGVGGRQLVTSQ